MVPASEMFHLGRLVKWRSVQGSAVAYRLALIPSSMLLFGATAITSYLPYLQRIKTFAASLILVGYRAYHAHQTSPDLAEGAVSLR